MENISSRLFISMATHHGYMIRSIHPTSALLPMPFFFTHSFTHYHTHIDKRNKTLLCILRSKAISAIWITYSFPYNKLTMYKTRDLFAQFSPLLLAISQNIIPIYRYTITLFYRNIYKAKGLWAYSAPMSLPGIDATKAKTYCHHPKSTMSYSQPISLVYMHHGTHIFRALDLIHFHH